MRKLLLFFAISGYFLPAFSQQDTIYPKKVYTTLRASNPPEIDGDMVAFQFDSYHDLQTAFTFFVSAAGSKMDG